MRIGGSYDSIVQTILMVFKKDRKTTTHQKDFLMISMESITGADRRMDR